MKRDGKIGVHLYLEKEVFDKAKKVKKEQGVPLTRLIRDGLKQRFKYYESIEVLSGLDSVHRG
jgi:hypothetical protein